MRAHSILPPDQRKALFDPPQTHEDAQARFALSRDDIALALSRRRSHNKFGFAVQLALVRDLGRPLRIGEEISAAALETIGEQLQIDPVVFGSYAAREETRREHAREIVAALKLRALAVRDYRPLITVATSAARATERGEPIVFAILETLKSDGILVGDPGQIERLALAGRAAARKASHRDLIKGLDEATINGLEALIAEKSELAQHRTSYGWLLEVPEGPKAKNFKAVIARLAVVRKLGIEDDRRKLIHANRYGMIARDAKVLNAREIGRMSRERRIATLTAFAIERQAALCDLAIDMFSRLIGKAGQRANNSRNRRLIEHGPLFLAIAQNHLRLARALTKAHQAGENLAEAVDLAVGWDGLKASASSAEIVLAKDQGDGLDDLIARRRSLRPSARLLLDTFVFKSVRRDDPLLGALIALKAVYEGDRRQKPATGFLPRRWRERIRAGAGGFDVEAWEVAVLVTARDRIRIGDLWVQGSRAWRSFQDYLMPEAQFDVLLKEGGLGLKIPTTFEEWRADREKILAEKMTTLAAAVLNDALIEAKITPAGLSISPISSEAEEEIKALSARLYALLPRIRIPALLAEVQSWTNFLDAFTHYRTGEAAADQPALMAAILADATNSGAERMAESSRGVTIHQMMLMIDRHVRPETYASATAILVDAQQSHAYAKIWGDGRLSSSDGQFFPAGGRGEATAAYNAKYGSQPGASAYGFISDRFASFYSRLISASEKEAPYVLDGLLHNEASLEISEHATDTAGATELIFALFPAFGMRLIPRIRNLGDRRLFTPTASSGDDWERLEPLIGGSINFTVIEEGYLEVLRLMASVGSGLVPPSVILSKINSSSRQGVYAKALREMGRLERSIFICDWLLDPAMRVRSHGILNKGEGLSGISCVGRA